MGSASADEVSESNTPSAPSVNGSLKRFATTAFGAEVKPEKVQRYANRVRKRAQQVREGAEERGLA